MCAQLKLLLALGMFALTCGLATGVTAEEKRPNIILCMGDDHGWDETGYNGHPYLKTPVLDQMAATGLRLDRFYAAHPNCSPTRGSVITGRHPNRYGTFAPNWSLRPEEISLAQLLSKAGYRCGHFGKWHLGPVKAASPTSPGAMGFHEWVSHDNFFELDPVLSHNGGPPQEYPGESSRVVVDEAIRFIHTATSNERPFFVVIWFGSPHEPYQALQEDLALYADLPDSYAERMVTLTSNETGQPTQRPLKDVLQERFAEITAMDRALGHLREWLDDQALRQNTLLWYCGDNGTPDDGIVVSKLRGYKSTLYEGGLRVPGIIEWPQGIREPRVSDVNSVTSDMLPTICELLNLSPPDRPLDGISLVPLMRGEMSERPQPIFFWDYNTRAINTGQLKPYIDESLQTGTTPLVKMLEGRFTRNFQNFHQGEITEADYQGARVVLDNQYKLVLDAGADGGESKELFDIRRDPGEQNNLLAQHPDRAARLEQQLRSWQQSVLHSLSGADYK